MKPPIYLQTDTACTQKRASVEPVHTREHPFCSHLACGCHTTVLYHEILNHPTYTDKEIQRAYEFYGLSCSPRLSPEHWCEAKTNRR